jgi:putative ATPase
MRPRTLDDYVGQKHLVGEGSILRDMVKSGNLSSFILWGPPGVGKTTLAKIVATQLKRPFHVLSAINSGVKDVREVIDKAKSQRFFDSPAPILFIDEIHRFSKSQQDSLLGAVEQGTVVLIGATTENPSFEVITPLLSRCQVYVLKSLDESELLELVRKAVETDPILKKYAFRIDETDALFRFAGGDARKLYNIIELLVNSRAVSEAVVINNKIVTEILQENIAIYDKNGEQHYDIISAFIKSVRGSDPNAAVYWLARMLEGGEDPKFIARRMVILASEDIGLANPNALLLATSCFQAVNLIGFPESRIILSQTAIYLATSPKSNSAYEAIDKPCSWLAAPGTNPFPCISGMPLPSS